MNDELTRSLDFAAQAIDDADALLFTAGAGMGVDSGLPDFRGDQGFWKAYPPFREQGLSFVDLANPIWFRRDPEQAWGFYGHRLNLYRDSTPHQGFEVLRRWATSKPGGHFVFTSNVDGQFQKAGFDDDRIVECHGAIYVLQCARPCGDHLWPVDDARINVDPRTIRTGPPLPQCPRCESIARPNILMFGDWDWVDQRSHIQQRRYQRWLQDTDQDGLVVVECGAGTAVPTVRRVSERACGTLVRINPREPQGPVGSIALPLGALEAITRIDALLDNS